MTLLTAILEDWRAQSYPSGTHVVTNYAARHRVPHLDIHGPGSNGVNPEMCDNDRDRYRMCEELAAFLNGGTRPSWLDDMIRVSETRLNGFDGSSIDALGPFYDANPPALCWRECDDQESKDARARLIDRLHLR